MMGFITIFIIGLAVVIAVWQIFRDREKRLLSRLEGMMKSAGDGSFKVEQIDETMLSAVENSMSRFLDDCSVSERNLKDQKQKIQTLISDISHQTVTPLSNILLYSQMLEEKIVDEMNSAVSEADGSERRQGNDSYAEMNDDITAIRQQAEKLSFLIESLVKTSRLETGIIKTVIKRVDICELVSDVIDSGKIKAQNKGITVTFDDCSKDDSARSIFVDCDRKWTKEALFNIFDNAVKYTSASGKIKLCIEEYSMFCRIDIADTGVGINEEDLPKIFGRFYRSERTREEEGVGLGLYLARDIIESEGGYIKVSSELGKGTIFSVFLNVSTL